MINDCVHVRLGEFNWVPQLKSCTLPELKLRMRFFVSCNFSNSYFAATMMTVLLNLIGIVVIRLSAIEATDKGTLQFLKIPST